MTYPYGRYEDYWQHSVALGSAPSTDPVQNGYLDLHDDDQLVHGKEGQYGPELFKAKANLAPPSTATYGVPASLFWRPLANHFSFRRCST